MRYEKAEILVHIALDMQGSAPGLSLDDIQRNYCSPPLSRRTAERLRDAVERVFPQLELANPHELPKRWRLPAGSANGLANITADELADLATAVSVLRRENMEEQAKGAERVISKMRALLKRPAIMRIDPDLEALTEAEGLAMRPGPRPKIDADVVGALRQAILQSKKCASITSIVVQANVASKPFIPTVSSTGTVITSWHGAKAIGQGISDHMRFPISNGWSF